MSVLFSLGARHIGDRDLAGLVERQNTGAAGPQDGRRRMTRLETSCLVKPEAIPVLGMGDNA